MQHSVEGITFLTVLHQSTPKHTQRRRVRGLEIQGQVQSHLPAQVKFQAIDGFAITHILVELQ